MRRCIFILVTGAVNLARIEPRIGHMMYNNKDLSDGKAGDI